jgi:MFS superfamily sulfate permease-like transporter
MKYNRKLNSVIMFLELFIMIVIVVLIHVNTKATDITRSIPLTILGASIFIAGYNRLEGGSIHDLI